MQEKILAKGNKKAIKKWPLKVPVPREYSQKGYPEFEDVLKPFKTKIEGKPKAGKEFQSLPIQGMRH